MLVSRLAGDNPGQGDIGIALSIAQAGNKGLAEQMLQSLPQLRHRYTSYWLNDWSVYLALVEAMCKWTINPSEDSVATIEEVLQAMRVANYNLEVNELQADIHQILATHNH
jgi:hypothetical protein